MFRYNMLRIKIISLLRVVLLSLIPVNVNLLEPWFVREQFVKSLKTKIVQFENKNGTFI